MLNAQCPMINAGAGGERQGNARGYVAKVHAGVGANAQRAVNLWRLAPDYVHGGGDYHRLHHENVRGYAPTAHACAGGGGFQSSAAIRPDPSIRLPRLAAS